MTSQTIADFGMRIAEWGGRQTAKPLRTTLPVACRLADSAVQRARTNHESRITHPASLFILHFALFTLLSFPVVSFADYVGLEVIDRSDLTICQSNDPEIPSPLHICEVKVVFNSPSDRLISVGFCDTSTTDPAGFYQHMLGMDTAPGCIFIPLFPTLVCDSFVTLGEECDDGDASATDPDFDSTAFNSSGTVSGGWFNSAPPNSQGFPDANGRVLVARFAYKHNKNTTGAACVFVTQGTKEIVEFPMQPFDCAVPGMQAGGPPPPPPPGPCVGDPDGGTKFCPDVELGGANEPAIAVNPLFPLNIAVARNPDSSSVVGQLRVSNDGGLNWSTALDAPFPPGFCSGAGGFGCANGDPSLAFTSDGRLFWAYIIVDAFDSPDTLDIAAVEVDPATGVLLDGPYQVINDPAISMDKPWLAAGPLPTPEYEEGLKRLYLAWKKRPPGGRSTTVSYADLTDLSAWSTPYNLFPPSSTDEPFPAHVAVGPTGIAYVAWHLQPNFNPPTSCPDGTGRVEVSRSTNGGVQWEGVTTPYPGGAADITWNAPTNCDGETIPMTRFCTAGSVQPWIVPDPTDGSRVYVIAADDPSPTHGQIDDSLIYIVRSGDSGANWDNLPLGPIKEIEPNPQDNMFQVFPTAAIDPETGDLVVLWYDNRNGQEFEDPQDLGNCLFYLDVFFSISTDHGETFSTPRQMNDLAFDHIRGAPGVASCPGARHMGEYIGVALTTDPGSGTQYLYAAWTGNTTDGQQIIFGKALDQGDTCPWDLNGDGAVGAFDLASLLANWGSNPCGPPDFNGDGDVGPFDLASLLAAWGPC